MQVRVTLGGISSGAFSVGVDWPQSTVVTKTQDFGLPGPPPGYYTINTMQLLSGCGASLYNMAWHEEFPTDASGNPASWNQCGQSQGWTRAIPIQPSGSDTGWAFGLTDQGGILTSADPNQQVDTVGYACGAPDSACQPASNIPGIFRGQPPDVTANTWSYQFVYVGSQDTRTLGKYWPAAPNKQVRYTDHGKDEPGTWICPGN